MPSRWYRLFEELLEPEIDHVVSTLTGGSCADYAAYCKEVGKAEAFRRVLDLAGEVDEKLSKGDY